jgi:hypothetical protein
MAAVLDANGFARLRLNPDGTVADGVPPDKPLYAVYDSDNRSVLDAFNGSPGPAAVPWFERRLRERTRAGTARAHESFSPVDVLFITQAGAEGINLRGVRQVHVHEPYWNDVRIQQVVGRAARTNSHSHLPEDQRRVAVYRYVSVFTPEQRANKAVPRTDGGKTSDEILYDVASAKGRLVSTFLDAIAAAAVDCGIYPGARVPAGECWSPDGKNQGPMDIDIAARADARADRGTASAGRAKGAQVRAVLDPGGATLRLFDKATGADLGKRFDAAEFRATGRLVEVEAL